MTLTRLLIMGVAVVVMVALITWAIVIVAPYIAMAIVLLAIVWVVTRGRKKQDRSDPPEPE
jgi:Flp pilus assembly protein TadB